MLTRCWTTSTPAACDGAVDLVKGFAFPLPFTAISELLPPSNNLNDNCISLGSWFTTLLHTPAAAPSRLLRPWRLRRDIAQIALSRLDRNPAARGEDPVTDRFRAADQDGALSEHETLSTIFQLVVAGHDTTTSLIGNATVALPLHPEQRDANRR